MLRVHVTIGLWIAGAAAGASGTAAAVTQPAPFELPPPATAPAVIDEPGTRKLRLSVPGREGPAHYWLHLPAGCGTIQTEAK